MHLIGWTIVLALVLVFYSPFAYYARPQVTPFLAEGNPDLIRSAAWLGLGLLAVPFIVPAWGLASASLECLHGVKN